MAALAAALVKDQRRNFRRRRSKDQRRNFRRRRWIHQLRGVRRRRGGIAQLRFAPSR
jgi:hypothetical protein